MYKRHTQIANLCLTRLLAGETICVMGIGFEYDVFKDFFAKKANRLIKSYIIGIDDTKELMVEIEGSAILFTSLNPGDKYRVESLSPYNTLVILNQENYFLDIIRNEEFDIAAEYTKVIYI